MPPRRSNRLLEAGLRNIAQNAPGQHIGRTDAEVAQNEDVFIEVYREKRLSLANRYKEQMDGPVRPYPNAYYVLHFVSVNFGRFELSLKKFFFAYYATVVILKTILRRYGRLDIENRVRQRNILTQYRIVIRDYYRDRQLVYTSPYINAPDGQYDLANVHTIWMYMSAQIIAMDSFDSKLDSQQVDPEDLFDSNVVISVEATFRRVNPIHLTRAQLAEQRLNRRPEAYMQQFQDNLRGIRQRLRQEHNLPYDFGMAKIWRNVQLHDVLNNSIQHIPFDSQGLCFPLSLLCSQSKTHYTNEESFRIQSTSPRSMCDGDPSYLYLPDDEYEGTSSHTYNSNIALFNPTKFPDEESSIQYALKIHSHVETLFDCEISFNSFAECMQAYAIILDCFIHVFVYPNPRRKEVYYPIDIWSKPTIRHVYLYVKDKHIEPIVNINRFLGIKDNLKYCDYCQCKLSESSDTRKSINHILSCIRRKNTVTRQIEKFVNDIRGQDDYCKFIPNVYGKDPVLDQKCSVCQEELTLRECYKEHICYFKNTYEFKPIDNSKLFVIDIESMQQPTQQDNKFRHQCVLLCMRNMYNQENRKEFSTEYEFVEYVYVTQREEFRNATILAHNGGGYDYQFILRACEDKQIQYSYIPTPNSDHKYLSFNIILDKGDTIRFIDFMALVPGSLKGIAKSFNLEIQKGDFPHRFLKEETLNYEGRIPSILHESDYFCVQQKKDADEVDEILEWHRQECLVYCCCEEECVCNKRKWNLQFEIRKYCWLDVDVLALACQKYRDHLSQLEGMPVAYDWEPKPIDPYGCFTQSQIAMNLFMQGLSPDIQIYVAKNRHRNGHSWKQFIWMKELDEDIQHIGNSEKEYYIPEFNHYCDGYKKIGGVIYEFLKCSYDGCPDCHPEREELNPERRMTWDECLNEWKRKESSLIYRGFNVVTIWECKFNVNEERECEGLVHKDRELFFGGRTEVFAAYCNQEHFPEDEIKYHDVCSLYPYVCSFSKMPFGIPTYLYGSKIDPMRLRPFAGNRYFGFALIKVTPNTNDRLGLLPRKDEVGRLIFDLYPKVGFWHTEEIYLAMENGYVVEEIYQVIHFEEDQCSHTLFRGYMEYWLRIKQESEGWKKLGCSSDNPSEEEKMRIIEEMYEENGKMARIRPDKVCKNPVMRQIAKIFLNCLWGKFCQRQSKDFFCDIDNYVDFQHIMFDCGLNTDEMKFREVAESTFKVKYTTKSMGKPNKKYNIFIAATVTASARCKLHRQALLIGPDKLLYCDTDSIVFLYARAKERLEGKGLGKWTDEYEGKNISMFLALAPKCYMIVADNNIEQSNFVKAKGVRLTLENMKLLDADLFKTMLYGIIANIQEEEVRLNNMTIFPNSTDNNHPYASMMTRYNTKLIGPVLNTKRMIVCEYNGESKEDFYNSISMISLFPIWYGQ